MTNTTEDLLFFKLKDLITEQSEGEWTDAMIVKDAHHFANNLRPMLAASPQGEGSSADASGIWRETSDASGHVHAPMDAVARQLEKLKSLQAQEQELEVDLEK